MSYTTQKEFFNVPFRNEDPKLPDRKRSDGALMTYDLCTDGRAWALDKQKRSNYILDVIHKARFKKALLHPEGQFELTKDYLIHLDADDLADYILSLQAEIKRKNEFVQELEESHKSLGEQLDAIQKQPNELTEIRQQSAILEQERTDFEQQMEDLEMVIVDLKDRADRYDALAKENETLRQQLHKQRAEAADRIRLVNAEAEANFNRMRAEDCEKLEAELILFKAQYEDLRQQKRELKEQLQKAFVLQSKLTELKRQLALEQGYREQVEDELERVLSLYDQRFQEVDDQNFATIEELEAQRSERWSESRLSAGGEAEARRSSTAAERIVESCGNCQQMQEEIERLRLEQLDQLQERERRNLELQEQVDSLRKELDLIEIAATGSDDQSSKLMEELKKCQAEIKATEESEQEAQTRIALLEENLAQADTKLAEETVKTEQLEAAAKSLVSIKGEPRPSVDDEVFTLQKLLEDVQAELALKVEELDLLNEENSRLQSAVVQHQEKLDKLEAIQQQQLIELETSRSELAQTKDRMTSMDEAELEDLKKMNDELQQEVTRLQQEELVASQSMSRGVLESVEGRAELLKTIEGLRAELQSANEAVKEKEEEIVRLKIEADAIRSMQQLRGGELAEIDEGDRSQQTAMEQERQNLARRIEELEEKLQQCEAEAKKRARSVVEEVVNQSEELLVESKELDKLQQEAETNQRARSVVEEVVDQPEGLLEDSEESFKSGKEELSNFEEQMVQRRSSMMGGLLGSGGQATEEMVSADASETPRVRLESTISEETIKAVESRRPNFESAMRDTEDEEAVEGIDEDDHISEADKEVTEKVDEHTEKGLKKKRSVTDKLFQEQMTQREKTGFLDNKEVAGLGDGENREEHGMKDYISKKRSLAGQLPQAQMDQLDQTGFLDDDIIRIGISDPDRTRMIAIKIARQGISVLVIGELDHLHREICRAIIERYLLLGQNVKAIDKGMYECHQILDSVKRMSNSEMKSMLPSTTTQVPMRNSLLLDADIPVRLPGKPKARPKSTSYAMGPQGQKAPGRILVGDYKEQPRDPFVSSLIASNIQGRIQVDDVCRTRAWRAPKTPTETFVASTLADGSRIVTRQKRYL